MSFCLQFGDFYRQLKERRVIRAAIIYGALLWAALQAADLFAGAGIISEAIVRWIILAGVVGFPATLIGSWFLESPWRERRWTAVAGDLLIIIAIGFAAALFAWQQWFGVITLPTIAIGRIEATDTRDDTQDLADHLASRFAMALRASGAFAVVESDADILLTGTLSQNDRQLRLTAQLLGADGQLIRGDRFDDRTVDQVQLQNGVLAAIWPGLGATQAALQRAQAAIAACDYPVDRDAILAIARWRNTPAEELDAQVGAHADNGLLHLARARQLREEIEAAPLPRRPVLFQLARQQLAFAEEKCPGYQPVVQLREELAEAFAPGGEVQ